MTMQTEVKR